MTVHPTFDALSAFADAPSDDVSQARVRRHVRACDACRATVDEIRAMGAAARAMPLRAAPSDLWARVAARRVDDLEVETGTTVTGTADAPAAPADVSSSTGASPAHADASRGLTTRGKSIAFGATLAVLALAASMMLPSRTPLEATGLSRLVVSPARPVAGGMIAVRYTPAPYFRHEPRLVLIGRVSRGGERRDVARRLWAFDADSLATLLPESDGSFVARVTLPANFSWAQLAVVDSTGDRMDRDGHALWTVVGGNADHSASLEALMSAEENRPLWIGHFDNRLVAGPQWSIADTIQRYFPGHPAGWAYYTRYGVRRGVLDFLRFFETAERKYASFDDALWPERALDADREHAMVVFARRIEEPLEAAKWATRLARAHPNDQRAFDDLYGAIHLMQINSTPGLADSMHTWLPLLIDVSRSGAPSSLVNVFMTDYVDGTRRSEAIASLVRDFGDSAMNQDSVHESFNMVGLYRLPVLYVLENNQFAMGTSLQRSTGQTDFVLKAKAHGIAGEKVDGMDVLNVLKVARRVIDRMRESSEPYFLEMECERFVGHGIGDDNTKAWATYRTQAQIDEARKRDPIVLFHKALTKRRLMSDAEAESLDKEVAVEVEEAIAFAEASPEPPLDSLYENVFS